MLVNKKKVCYNLFIRIIPSRKIRRFYQEGNRMNTRYKIKGDSDIFDLTEINHIGYIKREGDEWLMLTKTFDLSYLPEFATVRFDSRGVSAAYINGEFVAANTGRYANRITNAECTSKLKLGKNEIKLILGGHYYQTVENTTYARRKARFSSVAACLEIINGEVSETISTDDSWICESDLGVTTPYCFSQVTRAEYDRFWLSAALWKEERKINAPKAILDLVKGYEDYVSAPKQIYAEPCDATLTNMEKTEGGLISTDKSSNVLYRFDKIYCGYVEIEYEAEESGEMQLRFDYTGYPDDIYFGSPSENVCAKRLTVKKPIKAGRHTVTLVRRRACVYMMLCSNVNIKILSAKIRLDMLNHDKLGYFNCSEELFNDMWEIGKYTHHICKHQEYESCPRNEMKYFTGDGILAALIDAYTFGEGDLTVSSLSLTEMTSNTGLIYDKFIKNIGLTEYPAWRIVQAYNHYLYYNDTYFASQHFEELKGCLAWMLNRMNSSYLMYQYPIPSGAFCMTESSTDYSQNPDRLGEKPLVNALFYKSLICMASLADVVGDSHGDSWREIAEKVKNAINTRLWSEEKQAYYEPFNPRYIPQDGNALCILFGIAEGERAKTVMKTLEEKLWTPYGSTIISEPDAHTFGGNNVVSPTMNSHEAEARFIAGDAEGAVELMRRCWGSMIKRGTKTFWEYADTSDGPRPPYFTLCHAWGAGCTYLLSAYVLGIRPLTPGYGKLLFAPCGSFESFEGVVPTAKGLVAVRCKSDASGKQKFTVAMPKNTEIEVRLPENATIEITEY